MKHQLLIIIGLLFYSFVYGADEQYSSRITGSTSTIGVGTILDLNDDKYFEMNVNPFWSNSFTNFRVKNRIEVGLDKDVLQDVTFLDGEISLLITYKKWNTSLVAFESFTETKTLLVENSTDENVVLKDNSIFEFEGAHSIHVEVLSVSGIDLTKIFIESRIDVERYYKMTGLAVVNLGASALPETTVSDPFNQPENEYISLHWNYLKGAESYELEYVHINDYKLEPGVYKALSDISFNYYLNSTRVEVKTNHYRVPNIYDHGYFIYRVRPIGRTGSTFDERLYGEWSSVESGKIGLHHPMGQVIAITRAYDVNMNWVHEVNFVEDGKRFESVSYSDGLGKTHQTIGVNTETDQTIVTNAYYDELGRAVVGDLPSPVEESYPRHYPDYNRANLAGSPSYYYTNFDDPSQSDGTCFFEQYGMSDQYGAGKYYSSNNPNQEGSNGSIPDAEHYPFTRVNYRQDFTGRVDRVSSAGPTLSLGSGHTSQMIYVSPDQPELNALFGSEVGYSSHYEKLITIDANGQTYVQYFDMADRVVASYMTGPHPANLEEIEGTEAMELSVAPLVDGNVQEVDLSEPSSTLTYTTYFSENQEEYTFHYGFSPEQYTSICLASPICFDCVYDLSVKMVPLCGNTNPIDFTVTINGGELDAMCGEVSDYNYTQVIPITKGEYVITKRLSVNQAAIEDYWCKYIDNVSDECLAPVSSRFNEYYLAEPFEECNAVPEPVVAALSDCETHHNLMLMDMSPSGQYAMYSVSGTGVYSFPDAASIFNTTNWYGSYPDGQGGSVTFGAGDEALFITSFRSEWAEQLLAYHPEICYLDFCELNSSSSAYSQDMLDVYSFSEACSMGYISPLGLALTSSNIGMSGFSGCSNSSTDPFLTSGGINFSSSMTNYIQVDGVWFSMWQYYSAITYNPSASTASAITSAYTSFALEYDRGKGYYCLMDQFWINFRKAYLELKESNYLLAQANYATANNCSNAIIGDGIHPVYGNKVPQFPSLAYIQNYVNDSSNGFSGGGNVDLTDLSSVGSSGLAGNMLTQGCTDACSNYADEWLATLAGCIDPSDESALRQAFIDLCMSGCDEYHPAGASTSPSGTTIQDILSSSPFNYPETMECTGLLISEPAAYETQQELIAPFVVPLDVCGCDAIYQAQADFAQNGASLGFTAIEQMLAYTTGVSLEDADHILCTCSKYLNGTSWTGGNWLSNAPQALAMSGITIPASLGCETNDGCSDCEEVTTLINELVDRFDQTDLTSFQSNTNSTVILRNYLNSSLGFHLDYQDYIAYYGGCNSSLSNPYCTVNPMFEDWASVMKLIVFRGQLTSNVYVNLNEQNIVYKNSDLEANGLGRFYKGTVTGTSLSAEFSNGTESCTFTLDLGTNTFDFEDIVSFGPVLPSTSNCANNTDFQLMVEYFSCGQLQTAYLTGSTSCFEVNECICSPSEMPALCDTPFEEIGGVCYQPYLNQMYDLAMESYQEAIQAAYSEFKESYNTKCSQAFSTEDFNYVGPQRVYQQTLYYYDQAGNLVKTVAPKGVKLLLGQDAAINAARDNVTGMNSSVAAVLPTQSYKTTYSYNSYDQLTETENPDQDGATKYWYDRYGRIVASQNPAQLDLDVFSYSFYDELGRSVQVGQVAKSAAPTESILKANDLGTAFKTWVNSGLKTEVSLMVYDESLNSTIASKFSNGQQENLRLRVASVFYYDVVSSSLHWKTLYQSAIHYSYDIHGNVKEQLQDVPMLAQVEQDIKSTQYDYELLSGNVKQVDYQKTKADEFMHKYEYDQLNRLTEVFTSSDGGVHQTRQAHYRYYDYGPLSRIEIGENQVQGMDYAYTINGWLKGMNSSLLNKDYDIGKDGRSGYLLANDVVHSEFAKDVTSYTLGYFEGDYRSIDVNLEMEAAYQGEAFGMATPNLYNGNIRNLVTSIRGMATLGTVYRYDQLQRLKTMTAFEHNSSSPSPNSWNGSVAMQDYFNSYSYDRNGNITKLQRNGTSAQGLDMDNFEYHYFGLDGQENFNPATGVSSSLPSNRLNYVDDHGTDYEIPGTPPTEVYQDIKTGQNQDNYVYDKIGQLITDVSEEISTIEWRSGDKKIKKINRIGVSTKPTVEFIYNPFGQRVVKIVKPYNAAQSEWIYTYYAYDANGQVMATYAVNMSPTQNKAQVTEHHLYGASRLGIIETEKTLFENGTVAYPPVGQASDEVDVYTHLSGITRYEITNYLGNVNAVITDRKTWDAADVNYVATVKMSCDYYPFGMEMPGRHTSSSDYRFGYNGMEKDDEVKGEGNSYTTEFRQYDARLGRWLSLDPLMQEFPWMSPYVAFDNNPVYFTDPLGLAAEGGPPENPCEGDVYTREDGSVYDYGQTETGEMAWFKRLPEASKIVELTKCDYQLREDLSLANEALSNVGFNVTLGIAGVTGYTFEDPAYLRAVAYANYQTCKYPQTPKIVMPNNPSSGGDILHSTLDLLGMIPVVGEFFDAVNGLVYAAEGDWTNAMISFSATIPIFGSIGTGGRLVKKAATEITEEVEEKVVKEVGNEIIDDSKKIHGNSASSTKKSGHYEITFKSGKTYNGVGPKSRMRQSMRRLEKQYEDEVVSYRYSETKNRKSAYIREHIGIEQNGGPGNNKNYNRIHSPGRKYYMKFRKVKVKE